MIKGYDNLCLVLNLDQACGSSSWDSTVDNQAAGRGRFQVSATDKRCHQPQKRLNIQQACLFQQSLLGGGGGAGAAFAGEDDDPFQHRKVILGICAMSKKSNSKPMSEIIQRLNDNFDRLQ
ncbi:inositol hexakisphosphate and diphosphoinositol-pentakisphosphate kinase, partial [Elysia marginata]